MAANRPCLYPGCSGTKAVRGFCEMHAHKRRAEGRWGCGDRTVTQRTAFFDKRWRALRLMHIRRHPLCKQCGQAGSDVDHIVPRQDGGSDKPENLQTLCKSCHSIKTLHERNDRNKQDRLRVNCHNDSVHNLSKCVERKI